MVSAGLRFEKEGGISTRHIFLGDTRIASVSSIGDTSFYHSDHLGSTSNVTNKNGTLIQHTEYTPYGEFSPSTSVNEEITQYLFTGKLFDFSTQLYYYGARYYDPQLGRFTQADTIIPSPGSSQSFNRYSYCDNNPINYTDPTGHFKLKDFFSDWQSVVGIATTAVSMFCPPLAPAMWAVNTAISAYTAIETGNIASFAGGMLGGIVGGGLGMGVGEAFSSAIGAAGASPFNFVAGAIIGAGEFGVSGFCSGFGAAVASGASFSDSIKMGGQGAAIGAISGAAIQGSYAQGWQTGLHGLDYSQMGLSAAQGAVSSSNFNNLPKLDSGLRSRTDGKMGLWLHGTDKTGYEGINKLHSIFPGQCVTEPFARDPIAGKMAIGLNPKEYAAYTGIVPPKGEYLALAVGKADPNGAAKNGWAPEYLIRKNLAVAYKNPNR